MSYDAVVLSYKRPVDVLECVRCLQAQTVPPSTIYVWHNAPSCVEISGVVNIYAGENFGCRARHAFALLSRQPRCLFVDDHVFLGAGVAELLLAGHDRHPNSVIGTHGRAPTPGNPGPYSRLLDVCFPEEDTRVAVVKGFTHVVRTDLLALPFLCVLPKGVADEDDIVLNGFVQIHTHEPSWLIGGIPAGAVRNGPSGPEALCNRPDHWSRRDSAWEYLRSLGWDPAHVAGC